MAAIDPKTLAMMPDHVKARLAADGNAPARVTKPPTTIIENAAPAVVAAPADTAPSMVAAPAPAPAPESVALPNLTPAGKRSATAFDEAAPAPVTPSAESEELTKLRKELFEAKAAMALKPEPVWSDEKLKSYADVLGDDMANSLHKDLMSLRASPAPVPVSDAVTRKELAEAQRQVREDTFFKALPAEFYASSARPDSPFMQWATSTMDGRRSVKDELSAVVRDRDIDGVSYINEKLTQFAKHRGASAPAPGTVVTNGAPVNAILGEKQKATPQDQAAVRAMIRAGNLKGADEMLRQFTK